MKKYIILTIIIYIFSCKSQTHNINIKVNNSNLPVKGLLVLEKNNTFSALIFIPQEFALENTANIQFSNIDFSLNGGNVFGTNKSTVYTIKKDTLLYKPTKVDTYQTSKNKYKTYVSYELTLSYAEKKSLFTDSKFIQKKYGRKLFNLGSIKSINIKLNQKIPDSLKGFIHLNFKNPKTNQFDYLNIPVQF